jgi:methylthioribose-1-phosphate isomerase
MEEKVEGESNMKTMEFTNGRLWLLDQTRLPLEECVVECRSPRDVAEAIVTMKVRGAPAIGLAAAYGVVLGAQEAAEVKGVGPFDTPALEEAVTLLRATRPTAVNLFWALERMQRVVDGSRHDSVEALTRQLLNEADRMLAEDEAANRAMGRHGADLIPNGASILTHCNAGALATGAFGTALGALETAARQGKAIHVWVDETRPLLQGARLTAWELKRADIPFTLICDNMAASLMARGKVDLCMVGADRIVANGDAANKIGTYSVAVLAHAHGLPFYFVAPTSTVDVRTPSGDDITIEERAGEEVVTFAGRRVAPEGITVANPAFDVTPNRLIAAIVTERGVIRPPFDEGLVRAVTPPAPRPLEDQAVALSGIENA